MCAYACAYILHAVDDLAVAHLHAETRLGQVVRGLRHRLHTTADHSVGLAQLDALATECDALLTGREWGNRVGVQRGDDQNVEGRGPNLETR